MRVLGFGLIALSAMSAYALAVHNDLAAELTAPIEAGEAQPAALAAMAPQDLTTGSVTGRRQTEANDPAGPSVRHSRPDGSSSVRDDDKSLFIPPVVTPNPALAAAEPQPLPVAGPAEIRPPAPAVSPTPPAPASPSTPAAAAPASPVNAPVAAAAETATPAPSGPVDPRVAKEAFGAAATPSPLAARAIGFYSRGCLAGAKMLPVDGPAWQAMRLSRNRNWGHPELIRYVERLAKDAREKDGWPGLLVGDLSQPRGGPMKTGHASHQIGLDADVWFTPMPDRRLTTQEREDLAATDMLGPYKLSVDPAVWKPAHVALIKRAASYPEVERILVHPAIKKALCDGAGPAAAPTASSAPATTLNRDWLKKVRPYWGHHYHFHVRMACPPGNTACAGQAPPPNDDGCGKELEDWFQLLSAPPKPVKPDAPPAPPPKPMRVDQLPAECRQVLESNEPPSGRIARSPAAAKATQKAVARAKAQRAAAR